jgi:hypothetical protein
MRTVIIAIVASFAFSGIAFAKDGRFARPSVEKYYAKKGWSTDIRVTALKSSRSGKSLQVAVETNKTGKVRAFNVRKSSGFVFQTPTGLTKQSSARGTANLQLRRERVMPGAFSGVNSSGLSASGKAMRMNSATDKNEAVYVKMIGGKTIRFDK